MAVHLDNPVYRREVKTPCSNISSQQNRPWSPHEVKVDLRPPRVLALAMQGHNWHARLQGAQELEGKPDLGAHTQGTKSEGRLTRELALGVRRECTFAFHKILEGGTGKGPFCTPLRARTIRPNPKQLQPHKWFDWHKIRAGQQQICWLDINPQTYLSARSKENDHLALEVRLNEAQEDVELLVQSADDVVLNELGRRCALVLAGTNGHVLHVSLYCRISSCTPTYFADISEEGVGFVTPLHASFWTPLSCTRMACTRLKPTRGQIPPPCSRHATCYYNPE